MVYKTVVEHWKLIGACRCDARNFTDHSVKLYSTLNIGKVQYTSTKQQLWKLCKCYWLLSATNGRQKKNVKIVEKFRFRRKIHIPLLFRLRSRGVRLVVQWASTTVLVAVGVW